MAFAWYTAGKMQHCPFRRFDVDHHNAICLYPAVHKFQTERMTAAAYMEAADKVEEKVWCDKEDEG
jgi:hypothetical protein